MNYKITPPSLFIKYEKETWFNAIFAYLVDRYTSIEKRIIESDRYVSIDPKNNNAFSYEYSSILRDIGSVFGSVMDKFVRKTSSLQKEVYDMSDYKKWLVDNIPDIHLISVEVNLIIPRYIIPFSVLDNNDAKISWWSAYTDLKHSEVDNLTKGNLINCMDAMASLAVLLALTSNVGIQRFGVQAFSNIGFREPRDVLETFLFK